MFYLPVESIPRRDMLVPVPEFDDLQESNRRSLVICEQDMVRPHYLKKH